MLVDGEGAASVTNDGVTVLEMAKVEHPTANLLIASSSSQDRAARDGTTTTVILMAEMLQNALELVRAGIHPSIIINGYRIANDKALEELDNISRYANDRGLKEAVVKTSLQGKIDSLLSKHLTELALNAAESLSDEDGGKDLERLRIKRIQISGGRALDSELLPALVLAKTKLIGTTSTFSEGGRVAIIDGAIEERKLSLDAQIEINELGVLKDFQARNEKYLTEIVGHLEKLGVDLLIVRDGIADEAISILSEAGITAYRRFERNDLERLSKLTNTNMIGDIKKITKEDIDKRRSDRWNFLFIAGMWFQDLFNYDFRRTERCIIPYATQEGEISFCAYNTGIGWRNIIEKMHMTATLTKWYDEHGRHEIIAGGKDVNLSSTEHSLILDPEAVAAGAQTDLDEQGIAKNARQEKIAARDLTNGADEKSPVDEKDAAYHEQMAALYRQHVLKEEKPSLVQIQGLGKKKDEPVGAN